MSTNSLFFLEILEINSQFVTKIRNKRCRNKSETLYLSNFTADVIISDKAGKVLVGVQNLPVSEILSHHKNNEISLTVSLTQSNPFPVGDYMVKYLIRDVLSGNTFQIVKNIKVGNA